MENTEIKFIPMYKSYIDAVSTLTPEDRLIIYEAIFEYGFTGEEPIFDNPYLKMGWDLIKPNLDNNIKNHLKNTKNGKKGGRPRKTPKAPTTSTESETPKSIKIKNDAVAPEKEEVVLDKVKPTKTELRQLIVGDLSQKQIDGINNMIDTEFCTTIKGVNKIIRETLEQNKVEI